jgi:hypothetical protein
MTIDYAPVKPRGGENRMAVCIAGFGASLGLVATVGTGINTFCRYWWLAPGLHEANLGEAVMYLMLWGMIFVIGCTCGLVGIILGWKRKWVWVLAIFAVLLCAAPLFVHQFVWEWIRDAHRLSFSE